eukprot:9132318-Pyramimonas_sp.AAC.1
MRGDCPARSIQDSIAQIIQRSETRRPVSAEHVRSRRLRCSSTDTPLLRRSCFGSNADAGAPLGPPRGRWVYKLAPLVCSGPSARRFPLRRGSGRCATS